jgi:ATP-dependent DNA helicase RecQ
VASGPARFCAARPPCPPPRRAGPLGRGVACGRRRHPTRSPTATATCSRRCAPGARASRRAGRARVHRLRRCHAARPRRAATDLDGSLDGITGIGAKKREAYGEAVLEVIAAAQ